MSNTSPTVQDCMTPDPIAVKPLDLIETVIQLLEKHRISGLPVVDDQNHVVGVVTEADLLIRESPLQPPLHFTFLGSIIYFESPSHFHEQIKKSLGMLVQDVMTAKPITTTPETSLVDAAQIMRDKKVNRLPVLDQTQALIGILTRHDLICALKPQFFGQSES
ncbi:MAG: CBS domain-containing protein [Cyanobacteria bacterium P01_A01_bin.17]